MENYLHTTFDVYRQAAAEPSVGLCCTTTPVWQLPGLKIPKRMLEMNYGCGSTVHPRDLASTPRIIYVGVGGGMELLQFSYFTREVKSVVGIDAVDEMLQACEKNLLLAEKSNNWFKKEFIDLKIGNALSLPVEDSSIDVAAQNCLFNIFKEQDLKKALTEMYRVLKPQGRLILSDPICEAGIPENLKQDDKLRALCLTGALSLEKYLKVISDAGFGTIEIRARRPYRVLHPRQFDTTEVLYVESVEICAIKDPMPHDGPCVFTGRAAVYFGEGEFYDDGNGHILMNNMPLSVCDKTAVKLENLSEDIFVSQSTWFYDGGGCC